jgi:GntR family galactonate operon transcriptional repressor
MSNFTTVNRGRLYEEVATQMVEAIVTGAIPEGDFLPSEPRLAEQFGASRTVIREAVKVIVARKLARVEPGLGTRVCPAGEWNIFDSDVIAAIGRNRPLMQQLLSDLFAIRWMLEPQVARLAAAERQPAELEVMSDCVKAMEGLVAEPVPFFEHDMRFHGAILAASHNVVLSRMFDPIQELLRTSKLQVLIVTSPESRQESNDGHAAILHAIERQHAPAAEKQMRGHLELTAQELELAVQALRAEGDEAPAADPTMDGAGIPPTAAHGGGER